MKNSLLGRVVDELDTLGDVALQTGICGFEKLLLMVIGAANYVDDLLNTVGLDCVSEIFDMGRRV